MIGAMEIALKVHVEELPEGYYLATSEALPGLVAQGRTVAEVLEIGRDVAKKLIEARREREGARATLSRTANVNERATDSPTAAPVLPADDPWSGKISPMRNPEIVFPATGY